MRIAAVIPDWNGGDRLARTLRTVAAQTRRFDQVIVVDDGSSPPTICPPSVRLLRNERNTGFAAAVNRGIAEANADIVAILNNDVELAPDWLERIAEPLADPAVWFAAGKCLEAHRPDHIDGTYDLVSRAFCAWRAGSGRPDGALWSEPRTIDIAPMTAAVFRRSLFDLVGPLDERFISYLEDVEFGLRCASNGYTGKYVDRAVAYHIGNATMGRWSARVVRQIARNQVLLVRLHYPGNFKGADGRAIAIGHLLWGVLAARHGRLLSWIRGVVEGLRQPLYRAADERVLEVLSRSESTLYALQQSVGFDWYWRMYFALAGKDTRAERTTAE